MWLELSVGGSFCSCDALLRSCGVTLPVYMHTLSSAHYHLCMVLQCCYVRNTTRVSNFLFFLLQERYFQLVIVAFLYLTGNYCVSLALCVLMVCA